MDGPVWGGLVLNDPRRTARHPSQPHGECFSIRVDSDISVTTATEVLDLLDLIGTWLKEEGFCTVAGRRFLGGARLLRRPSGPTVD